MKSNRRTSIVIPCRDSLDTLKATLESIAQSEHLPAEVIVIDDGSQNMIDPDSECLSGPTHRLRSHKIEVKTHRLSPGQGPAAARNAGAHLAVSEYILFIDADVLLAEYSLKRIEETFANQPKTAAIQGLYSSDVPEDRTLGSRYQNHYYHHAFLTISGDYPAVCATYCFAIRRGVFQETGGFDASIQCPTVEDEAFGYHLSAHGHRIFLHRGVLVTHLANYSFDSMLLRKFRMSFNQVKSALRGTIPPVQGKENKTHHSKDTLFAVLIAPLLPLLLLGSFPAFLMVFLCYTACNARFWAYLSRVEAPVYFLEMCFLTWVDQVTIFVGLSSGTIDFLLGRKF